MVGSSLASLLAHSWVSLDFDLASVSCQELNGKQQLDEKTVVEVLLFKARSLLGRYVVLKKLSTKTWIIYLGGPSVVQPWHNANLKLKDLVRTTSFLVGEPWALLSWASGMEQR